MENKVHKFLFLAHFFKALSSSYGPATLKQISEYIGAILFQFTA